MTTLLPIKLHTIRPRSMNWFRTFLKRVKHGWARHVHRGWLCWSILQILFEAFAAVVLELLSIQSFEDLCEEGDANTYSLCCWMGAPHCSTSAAYLDVFALPYQGLLDVRNHSDVKPMPLLRAFFEQLPRIRKWQGARIICCSRPLQEKTRRLGEFVIEQSVYVCRVRKGDYFRSGFN